MGTQLLSPKKGSESPIFGPCLLCPNAWMDPDATRYVCRPRPNRHCVRWGPISHSPKGAQPPIFGPYLLWPNGWMDEDATWYGSIHLGPGHIVLDGDPACPTREGHSGPLFLAHAYCGHGRPSQLLLSFCYLLAWLWKVHIAYASYA